MCRKAWKPARGIFNASHSGHSFFQTTEEAKYGFPARFRKSSPDKQNTINPAAHLLRFQTNNADKLFSRSSQQTLTFRSLTIYLRNTSDKSRAILTPGSSQHSPDAWLVPAQPVDATPSNALIRLCFPGGSDLFGYTRPKPGQRSVPACLTQTSDLAFVFNVSPVLPECCVDPLRPPF